MHIIAIAESGYWNLPLPTLDKSSTNPRRNFELDRFNIVRGLPRIQPLSHSDC